MKKNLLLALVSAFSLNAQTVSNYTTDFLQTAYAVPFGLVFDSTGNLYIANNDYNKNLGITKMTPNLVQSTFISLKKFPRQIALDANQNFWVISRTENGYKLFSGENEITKITPGDVISYPTSADIWGIAIDATGNVFYSERTGKIQKISTTGEISTFFSDPATLKSPSGLAFDKAGNLFVIDESDGNNPLKKISPAGIITKIPLTFEKTSQIIENGYLSFASNGDLYISGITSENNFSAKIFRLPAADVSGKLILFYDFPDSAINGIAIYNGNLYASIYAKNESKVVKIAPKILGVENATKSITKEITVYPNPAIDYLSIDSKNEVIESIQLFDLTGHLLKSYKPAEVKEDKIALPTLTSGNYILKINNTSKKIIIN
ncbi:T9SS type A sorting domain-containing protein [Flavobacterium lipolyticum]|uniref:T9SS type A sorting domain-containing protein n=1 Tax=Flavobacterium lipolyticum TaxID=2893754 RepID=A0ABS8LY28_9FLAO|nr:T9SS type A sorting domain-containing protein [Flavobacterium sp. F-126]MCC9016866.1 T9SS type A sorting domain-containing protein [Flavobacterium sp. F-126]